MAGVVRCHKCGATMEGPICSKCGSTKAAIKVYWKGKHWIFRRYSVDGGIFDYDRAVRQLNNIRSAIDARTFNPQDWSDSKIRERKFENKIEDWIAQKETEAKKGEFSYETLKNYRGYVKHHFGFFLGWDVREIGTEQIEDFKDKLPESLKIKTRRNILNALHAFFNWLYRRGTISKVPVFPHIEGDDAEVRTALDYDSQIAGLQKIPHEHKDVIEFAFETGKRSGEICALKVKDLDVKAGTIWIRRTWSGKHLRETTKGKKKQLLVLSDRALQIAVKRAEKRFPDEFLFINPGTGGSYRPKVLNRLWKDHSGLDTDFHSACRHSFITQLVEAGNDISAVKELAGHSDIRTTMRYTHLRTQHLREIVNRRGKLPVRKVEGD
jgi:integrase/recombinase XerD